MAWSRLQSASASAINAANLTVTYPSNVVSGSKLISAVAVSIGGVISTTGVQDGGARAETRLAFQANASGAGEETSLWAMDTPTADVGIKPAITATPSVSPMDISMLIQEVSGLLAGNTTAMVDGTAGTITGSAIGATASPTYSSTALNEYLVAVYGDNGGPITWTVPTGYTGDPNGVNASSVDDIQIAYKNSTNGAEASSWSLAGTATNWSILTVAFKLASVQTPVPPGVAVSQALRRPHLGRTIAKPHVASAIFASPWTFIQAPTPVILASGTSTTIALTSVTTGDLIVVVAKTDATGTISDNLASSGSWTEPSGSPWATNKHCYWKVSTATGAMTITVANGGAAGSIRVSARQYTPVAGTVAQDGAITTVTNAAAIASPISIGPTPSLAAGDLVVAGDAGSGTNAQSAGAAAPNTNFVNTTTANGSIASEDSTNWAGGAATATFSWSGSNQVDGVIIAFKISVSTTFLLVKGQVVDQAVKRGAFW